MYTYRYVLQSQATGFRYVLFDWDNFFASFLAAADDDVLVFFLFRIHTHISSYYMHVTLEPQAKNASYSNLIQIVKARTSKGFVPNFSGGGDKSIDRTEPPVGGMILKEIWDKFHDDWIVHLLFPDLVAWNDWFVRERTWCQ